MNLKPLSLKYLAPVALTAAILTPGMARAQAAITVDPALTAAIGTQTITLQEEYKKRRTLKEEIIASPR